MKYVSLIMLCALVMQPYARTAHAAEFNPNNILSDFELEDFSSLSQDAIQRFLEQKGSFLATFTHVVENKVKSASQIIYDEALTYSISPKFILAMLQKEQSLITDRSPSQNQLDWAAGFGVCDSCSKNDPALQPLKGFYNQVSGLAQKVRMNYLRDLQSRGQTFTGWGPGTTKRTLDQFDITPVNNATAVLYTYNPYQGGNGIGANYNFWRIWQRYFTRNYPDGTLLQQKGQNGVWLLQNGMRRPFTSRAALFSRYSADRIIQVSQNELEKYHIGAPIQFANYSLLRAPWGTVYLLVDDTIRGITSRDVFRTIGFNPEEVIDVSKEDIAQYREGEPVTIASAYPAGALLQDERTGAVFYVENGTKQPIIDRVILSVNYQHHPITPVHPEELSRYTEGARMLLKEGTIIKDPASSTVYVISAGKRRPIVSGEAFEKLGYRWEAVVEVPQKVMLLHEPGDIVDIVDHTEADDVLGDNEVG